MPQQPDLFCYTTSYPLNVPATRRIRRTEPHRLDPRNRTSGLSFVDWDVRLGVSQNDFHSGHSFGLAGLVYLLSSSPLIPAVRRQLLLAPTASELLVPWAVLALGSFQAYFQAWLVAQYTGHLED